MKHSRISQPLTWVRGAAVGWTVYGVAGGSCWLWRYDGGCCIEVGAGLWAPDSGVFLLESPSWLGGIASPIYVDFRVMATNYVTYIAVWNSRLRSSCNHYAVPMIYIRINIMEVVRWILQTDLEIIHIAIVIRSAHHWSPPCPKVL